MKKAILLLVCALSSIISNAQLKVGSNGRVTIGTTDVSSYPLSIKGNGGIYSLYMDTYKGGGAYIKTNTGGGSNRCGLRVLTNLANDTITSGVEVKQNGISNLKTYGVYASGGKSTNLSTGVFGTISGIPNETTNGACIYGGTLTFPLISAQYQGIYAGYFYGDVRVTGSLYGTLLTPSSSANASNSTDIVVGTYTTRGEGVEEESVSEKLQQVQLLQFYRSPDENKLSEEEIEEQRKQLRRTRLAAQEGESEDMSETSEDDDLEDEIIKEVPQTKLSTIRYGLDTEQLKDVYPELVYEDQKGNVSINYIEMIPLLVQAVNEVKAENETLKYEIAELKDGKDTKAKVRKGAASIDTPDEAILSLSQNNPNPFSSSTSIGVSVPESIKSATLFVYDMSGKQIKRIDIAERGASRINITSEGLGEGMYLYSLIADGKVVGTKKMILVK